MSESVDFELNSSTYKQLLESKNNSDFRSKSWNEWFNHVFPSKHTSQTQQEKIEGIAKDVFYDTVYDLWIQNFSSNLQNIWKEKSAKTLSLQSPKENSAIVIGRGPSIKKYDHLKLLAESNFSGNIVCTDGALINALEAGITPDKFPNFYVTTIDVEKVQRELYDHKLVDEFGSKITGIFSSFADPKTAQRAREAQITLHWLHPLVDYNEGRKSLNYIFAQMVRTKKDFGLPGLQTGGNVGTSCWFISWQILKCTTVTLIGINHGWEEETPIDLILSHGNNNPLQKIDKNSQKFKRLFPKIFNPEFNCNCILDPLFQYYSSALKEFIRRSPEWLTTINATEGGCIFGERINCMKFKEFLTTFS